MGLPLGYLEILALSNKIFFFSLKIFRFSFLYLKYWFGRLWKTMRSKMLFYICFCEFLFCIILYLNRLPMRGSFSKEQNRERTYSHPSFNSISSGTHFKNVWTNDNVWRFTDFTQLCSYRSFFCGLLIVYKFPYYIVVVFIYQVPEYLILNIGKTSQRSQFQCFWQ